MWYIEEEVLWSTPLDSKWDHNLNREIQPLCPDSKVEYSRDQYSPLGTVFQEPDVFSLTKHILLLQLWLKQNCYISHLQHTGFEMFLGVLISFFPEFSFFKKIPIQNGIMQTVIDLSWNVSAAESSLHISICSILS